MKNRYLLFSDALLLVRFLPYFFQSHPESTGDDKSQFLYLMFEDIAVYVVN